MTEISTRTTLQIQLLADKKTYVAITQVIDSPCERKESTILLSLSEFEEMIGGVSIPKDYGKYGLGHCF